MASWMKPDGCPTCGGNGRVYDHVQDDTGQTCWTCKGTGKRGEPAVPAAAEQAAQLVRDWAFAQLELVHWSNLGQKNAIKDILARALNKMEVATREPAPPAPLSKAESASTLHNETSVQPGLRNAPPAPSARSEAERFFSTSGPKEWQYLAFEFNDYQRDEIFKFADAFAKSELVRAEGELQKANEFIVRCAEAKKAERLRAERAEGELKRLREERLYWKRLFHIKHSEGLTIAPMSQCEMCKAAESVLREKGSHESDSD